LGYILPPNPILIERYLNIQFPFISVSPFLPTFSYKAATKAATSPATPPNPAIIAFAPPVELTGGGVVDVFESVVEFDLVVVGATLVVAAVVEVLVVAAVVLEGVLEPDELFVTGAAVVVVADAVAMDAEYAEHRA